MRLTVKLKLLLLVCVALLSLALVVGISESISRTQQSVLDDAEERLLPRLELGPKLDAEFVRLRQGIQDAVAAQDLAALEATMGTKTRIFDSINGAGAALEPSLAASLRWSVQDYFETARSVSRRLIAGEAGEDILEGMRDMQDRQRRAETAIRKAAGLDRAELNANFARVRSAGQRATWLRMGLGLAAVTLVLLLWLWASGRLLRALGRLAEGFQRFEQGELTHTIRVEDDDELGDVAREANRLAASLRSLGHQRARADWVKDGLAELSGQLQGSLMPDVVAERVLGFLVDRTCAVAGAIYVEETPDTLTLMLEVAGGRGEHSEKTIRRGEGLVGQAFTSEEVRLIEGVPAGYFEIRSALGSADPRFLVLVPLSRVERCVGVVELALFEGLDERALELVNAVRTMIVVAFEAALADRTRRRLLRETQDQAERLTAQEEELRVSNQELLSQRRALESANEELEAQKRTLAERNAEVELARERVQEKAEELGRVSVYKSQFLANMSHELRTPLNSMLLLSHLMAENQGENLTPKQIEYCKTIHSAGEDLLGLINQVLDLSKIEAGKQDVDLENVHLATFAEHARNIFEPLAIQKGLRFTVEVHDDLPGEIKTDRRRVERILTNLLGNAIKFTDRGSVRLSIGRPRAGTGPKREDLAREGCVALAVEDTGIGIEGAEYERVFAAFEQVEAKSDRRYQGTGLGLAIARESAGLLGGELQLESLVGCGSTFTLYLPLRVTARETVNSLPAGRPEDPISPLGDDLESIVDGDYLLIVEDDAVLAEQLVDLVHARGLRAAVTSSGRLGLEQAKRYPPKGIILDVRLPDVDGWTVMERLKEADATRAVPVHFLSALDASQHGLALGAVGYLTKPASRSDLSGVVKRLIPHVTADAIKILVVEDSSVEAQSVVELLGSQGIVAERAASAGEALEKLEGGRFGCVILDLGLPDVDGLGLLEALRTKPELVGTRIIVHTGRSLSKRETRQLEDYAEAIVLKDGSSGARLLEEVRLFVHHVEERLPSRRDPLAFESSERDASLSGRIVLVAEDDMRTVYSLSALLRSRGCEVLIAENGREAVEQLRARPDIDLVLMDVMMPEMDGYQAVRVIRQDARFSRLPIVSLTAKAMMGERERCLEAGATDYLAKPVDSKTLLAKIAQHLHSEVING